MMNETEKKARIAVLEGLLEKIKDSRGKDLMGRMSKGKPVAAKVEVSTVESPEEGEGETEAPEGAEASTEGETECPECKAGECEQHGKRGKYEPSEADAEELKKLVSSLF